jgi:hypothetical protein
MALTIQKSKRNSRLRRRLIANSPLIAQQDTDFQLRAYRRIGIISKAASLGACMKTSLSDVGYRRQESSFGTVLALWTIAIVSFWSFGY